ncbi:MAG: HAD hydrolase family protein [bacterium]
MADIKLRTYKPEILKKAKKIKLIAMDIDGVLTNGDIIVRESGEEVKIWNVRDRIAFHFAEKSKSHLKFVWITGRGSRQVEQRAAEIKIDSLYQYCMNKKEALCDLMNKYSLSSEKIAFIGDDLIDIPVLNLVGLSMCPADAAIEVLRNVDIISRYNGGKGVLREMVEIILKSKGLWEKLVNEYT